MSTLKLNEILMTREIQEENVRRCLTELRFFDFNDLTHDAHLKIREEMERISPYPKEITEQISTLAELKFYMNNDYKEVEIENRLAFIKNAEELVEKMKNMECTKEGNEPVTDGLLDPVKYYESPVKIMTLLKEPVNNNGESLTDILNNRSCLAEQPHKGMGTFGPLVVVCDNILNRKENTSYNNPEFLNNKESYDAFKSSAYVNISKEAGPSQSDNNVIREYAERNKELLQEQFKLYNPDVVLSAGTLKQFDRGSFYSFLGEIIPKENVIEVGKIKGYYNENRLFIDAPHPQYTQYKQITVEEYCKSVTDVYKKWEEMKFELKPELLEAPHDYLQIERISDCILNCDPLRYENWIELPSNKKMDVLSSLEKQIACIEHRPECPIFAEDLEEEYSGYFSSEEHKIVVNKKFIDSTDEVDYYQVLETLIHEGRHAYQDYNMYEREVHPVPQEVNSWRENIETGYLSPAENGWRAYRNQPIEVDARNFTEKTIITVITNKQKTQS
jgi:hypothetical protein